MLCFCRMKYRKYNVFYLPNIFLIIYFKLIHIPTKCDYISFNKLLPGHICFPIIRPSVNATMIQDLIIAFFLNRGNKSTVSLSTLGTVLLFWVSYHIFIIFAGPKIIP